MEPIRLPECEHQRHEIRRRLQTNGVKVFVRQCLDCGANMGAVAKKTMTAKFLSWSQMPEFDEALRKRWWESRTATYQNEYQRRRELENAEWWAAYEAHLASPQWALLRAKVLLRCRNICEGCGVNRAVQVHHLTYAHLGDELLFELVGVCQSCHEKAHGRPIGEEVRH